MKAKFILLSVVVLLSGQHVVSAQTFGTGDASRDFQRMREVWGAPGEQKRSNSGLEAGESSGCGFGCVLFLGAVAGLVIQHYSNQHESRIKDPPDTSGQGPATPPDEGYHALQLDWRVKEFTGEAVNWPYLNMYSEASTDAPILAGLKSGFAGIHMIGQCIPASGNRGMCPVAVSTERGELEGWVLGDMIEVIPDSNAGE